MSRIGKLPITLPKDINISVDPEKLNYIVSITGKLGSLSLKIPNFIKINVVEGEDRQIFLEVEREDKESKSYWGLYRSLLNNAVVGVSVGFTKELEIQGIGYRAEMKGNTCVLSLGLSHKISYEPPQGISIAVADQVNIKVFGIDKQLVGEVAAKIRAFRKPEPYKGKGVRYKDEVVKKKSTKSGK
jgi:large subunit ribosomal protein L6